jgi:hypothetical protein
MLGIGVVRCVGGCPSASDVEVGADVAAAAGPISLFVILHAFSSGSTALTGVEAFSNGVPAFRRPQSKNAAETLAVMGVIAITMFLGISWLATHIDGVTVSEEQTVIAQIGDTVFGGGIGFYILSFFTASILVLAANTAYQDFPRLSAILARDHYMPRQFMKRGDRLVFSNGVIGLAFFASVIIVVFNANLTQLIQLYVVGVFTSFTLSQTGMVRHWLKERRKGLDAQRGWQRSMVINVIGAITTGLVLLIITYTKFVHGAWLSITAMALLVPTFSMIHRHYAAVARQLRRGLVEAGTGGVNHMVLVIRDLDAAAAEAVGVVRSVRPAELHILHPSDGPTPVELQERWREFSMGRLPARAAAARRSESPRRAPSVRSRDRPGSGRFRERCHPRGRDRLDVHVPVPACGADPAEGRPAPRAEHRRDGRPRRRAGRPARRGRRPAADPRADGGPRVRLGRERRHEAGRQLRPDAEGTGDEGDLFRPRPRGVAPDAGEWGEAGMRIPLDIVQTPFRDLTGPMLDEVRRFTGRPGTLAMVAVPEFIVSKRRHLLLHNQNALFVKRLFLFEPNVVLSSVPFVLEKKDTERANR